MTTEITKPQRSRPGKRQVTIEDCSSVRITVNESLRCPHDRLWRPSTAALHTRKQRAEFCQAAECAAVEFYPQAGNRIVVNVPRTFEERRDINEWWNPAPGSGAADHAELTKMLLQRHVVSWTWTDQDDEPLPLPSEDWDRVARSLDVVETTWIAEVLLFGQDPDEQLRESGN